MSRYPSRSVGPVLRWYSAALPLAAALASVWVAVFVATHDGNRWCNDNSFSCSLYTNLLVVVALGAATTYWYFGLRRGLLLVRYRRQLRAYVAAQAAQARGGELPATSQDVVTGQVLAAHRDWRTGPRVTLVVGSGKEATFVKVVSQLTASGSWMVPVPVGRVDSASPADLLRSAKQELEVILLDIDVSQELVEWFWRSLLRCQRLLFVVEGVERIAPSMPSAERELVVRRLFVSARQLHRPLFGTSKPDLLDSPPGSVFELPPVEAAVIHRRLATVAALDEASLTMVSEAAIGALATPYMVERLVWMLRRAGDATVAALRVAPEQARDLVLWQLLLAEQAVPGAVLNPTTLQLVAFHLTMTGRIEVAIPDGDEWRRALANGVGTELPLPEPTAAEVYSYVEGGFLDAESNRSVLRFASSDIQSALAAEHLVTEPDRITAILPQLAVNATARNTVANALRLDDSVGGVHAALLRALALGVPPASEAAGLCLALRHPPQTLSTGVEEQLAERLTRTLADRISSSSGPVLSRAGQRDAVDTLNRSVRRDAEQQLLLALHSSQFPVRLSVALALLRRSSPDALLDGVTEWINQAESPTASGVQHQLSLALWFCAYLREQDSDGRGIGLYARGAQLARGANPLLFETSLCRGFKFAAWTHPRRDPDLEAVELLDSGMVRFWYSRVSLVHALGIRLASRRTAMGSVNPAGESVARAEQALRRTTSDAHPLVREAASLTYTGVLAGRPPESFSWLAETDIARSNTRLDDAVQRLLGDISLFLTLIYCAEPWPDELWQQISATTDLPLCIRRPADRQRHMLGGCPPECPFGLCPYPGPARRGRGHGELSGAFCRIQADLALALRRAPWQEKHRGHELAAFWFFAEEHLANRNGWEINL
ncbi:MAG: hypothetical protein QOK09_2917 [Mycobacterium sp.]|nr:hypothetical protein [Mycobacterium sp.]